MTALPLDENLGLVERREPLAFEQLVPPEGTLQRLGPGDHFGELALLGGRHRGEVVTAGAPLTLARFSAASWAALESAEPGLAVKVATGVARALADELARVTGDVGLLLRGWRKGLDADTGHVLPTGVSAAADLRWWSEAAVAAAG